MFLFALLDWHLKDLGHNVWAAQGQRVFEGNQYWRVFTATLVHADMKHFLSNAYMLFFLGYFIHAYFGFWVFPVAAFFWSAAINCIALFTYPSVIFLLGASGGVYWLAGFWFTLYVFTMRQLPVYKRLLRVGGVGLVVLFPSTFEPNVGYRVHLIGFILGICWGIVHFFFHKEKIRSYEVFDVFD